MSLRSPSYTFHLAHYYPKQDLYISQTCHLVPTSLLIYWTVPSHICIMFVAFNLFFITSLTFSREGNGNPLQYSCLENPMDGGAWWAAVHRVVKSPTRLSDFTFTFHFHALEKEMATHSSVLAWRIPGAVEPGGLPSMGSHRIGHDWSDLAAALYIQCRSVRYVSNKIWAFFKI